MVSVVLLKKAKLETISRASNMQPNTPVAFYVESIMLPKRLHVGLN